MKIKTGDDAILPHFIVRWTFKTVSSIVIRLVVTDLNEKYTLNLHLIFLQHDNWQLKRQESLEFLNQNVSSFEQQAVLFPHKTAHDIFIFEA